MALITLIALILLAGKLNNEYFASAATYPVAGKLQVVTEDDFTRNSSRTRYFVQDTNNNLTEISADQAKTIAPGSRITFDGTNVTSIEQAPSESNAVTGSNKIAVILANFNNLSVNAPTNSKAKTMMDSDFSPFFGENSLGKATMTGDVYGWVTMNIPATCELSIYAPAAIAAADPQINYNNYKYVMVVFPGNNCPYSGVSYMPPGPSFQTGEGNKTLLVSALPSYYFLNYLKTNGNHEVGHSLGLTHANGWECGATTLSSSCTSAGYGDQFDVMGGGGFKYQAHYGAYFKEYLQWISPQNIQTVTSSGTYSVNKIETASGGIQSLKIPMEGSATYYNIENRTATGSDASLPANALNGALIKIVPNSVIGIQAPNDTNILDSSPNSSSTDDFNDAGFAINQTFTDTGRAIEVTPLSKTNGILSVKVRFVPPNLISPVNGANTTKAYFDWSDIPLRSNYTIQISSSINFSSLLLNSTVTDSQYTATGMPINTKLYWRVRANYSFGSSDWSDVYSTTIQTMQKFCPANSVTRDYMSKFVLKTVYGASYAPPGASGTMYTDVPKYVPGTSTLYWAAPWIEKFSADGYSAGCGGGKYCPTGTVNREQIAVFMVRLMRGNSFVPPAASGTVFSDVPKYVPGTSTLYWAAPWIEQAARDNITAGCGGGKYCPTKLVSKEQMSVFLLRKKYGSSFVPPAATGTMYTDVPKYVPGTSTLYWAAPWIEQVSKDGIIGTENCI